MNRYILFFDDDGQPAWWRAFTRPGYRHVAVIDCQAPFLIEMGPRGIFTVKLHEHRSHWWHEIKRRFTEAIPMMPMASPGFSFPIISCVDFARTAAGLPRGNIWTPWQLRQALRKQGRQSIVSLDDFWNDIWST